MKQYSMIPKRILNNPHKCPKFDIRCGLSKPHLRQALVMRAILEEFEPAAQIKVAENASKKN